MADSLPYSSHYVRRLATIRGKTSRSNAAISFFSATLFFYLRRSKTGFSSACPSLRHGIPRVVDTELPIYLETDTIIERLIRTAIETAAVGAIFCVCVSGFRSAPVLLTEHGEQVLDVIVFTTKGDTNLHFFFALVCRFF